MKYTIQDFDVVARLYKDYLLIKNFSKSTLVTYLSNFRRYHICCEAIGIDEVYTQDSVKKYLVYRVETGAKWQMYIPVKLTPAFRQTDPPKIWDIKEVIPAN